jgi:uncharacterized protein
MQTEITNFTQSQVEQEQREFIVNVYKWMSMGLFLTAAVAYIVAGSKALTGFIFGSPFIFFGLMIGEVLLVGHLAVNVKKMSASTAMNTFLGYSALNGLTLSCIFLLYTAASITTTFVVTAGTFGIMSVYGYVTKKDLTSVGNICFMGLIGLIIASLVNMFLNNGMMYWIITYAGILIFVGLTAYDTQKIKQLNIIGNSGTEEDVKESISGALILYLDFINLFLMLLRLFGNRK